MSRKNTKSEAAAEPLNPQLPTDGIIVLEGEHGNITAWNLGAEAIFGHTRAEALGQELHHLLTPP